MVRSAVVVLLMLVGLTAPTLRAQGGSVTIDASIKSYGFRGGTTTRELIRESQWIPMIVEMTLTNGQQFEGELHVECVDLDGDFVTFVEGPFVLTGGAGAKRVWAYGLAYHNEPDTPRVTLHDTSGRTVMTLSAPQSDIVSNDHIFVLDISQSPVVRLRLLQRGGAEVVGGSILGSERPYARGVVVGQHAARELPDRWWGLEAVDVIVWDEPDPDVLDNAQIEALKQWVHHGGQLVLGLGKSWQKIVKSPLAELIPLKTDGAAAAGGDGSGATARGGTISLRSLPRFCAEYCEGRLPEFEKPIIVVPAEATRGLRIAWDKLGDGPLISLMMLDHFGAGRVICVAASVRDLAQISVGEKFVRELVDLTPIQPELVKNESEQIMPIQARTNRLYDRFVERVDLRQVGGLFAIGATAFVLGYIGVATFGSWWWLRRRNISYLSWSVFAGFAVVASAFSLAAVSLSQGLGVSLHEIDLVDAQAGAAEASAWSWFGLRTPRQPRARLALPGEGNYLRGLSQGGEAKAKYATPQHYRAQAGRAVLLDAPMRATLKQFEGHWHGEMQGAIRAQLAVDRRTARVLPGSWIKNDLPAGVTAGYLLFMDPRARGNADRATNVTGDYQDRREKPPSASVIVVELPHLPAGDKLENIGAEEYKAFDEKKARYDRTGKLEDLPELSTLFGAQELWMGESGLLSFKLQTFDRSLGAALLMSTRNLYLHCQRDDVKRVGQTFSTEGLVDVDVTHWLTAGQGVLLLISEEPGPVRLHVDDSPLRPRGGLTVYRVRVPIELRGAATGEPL